MTNINYAFKADVLQNHADVLKFQKQLSKINYIQNVKNKNNDLSASYVYDDFENGVVFTYDEMQNRFYDVIATPSSYAVYKEAAKINVASYKREQRLRQRVKKIITSESMKSYFLTFTFNDDVLNNTESETRRRYVQRWLKQNCKDYVANIDFGAENGREHYHAVVCVSDKMDFSEWHQNGAINSEIIKASSKSSKKLSKYISKLTNHAIKETTKRSVYIYART